jgi:hypothetical protein
MASDPRLPNRRVDRDGVTVTYTRAARAVGAVLACTLAVLGVAAWLILRAARRPEVRASTPPPPPTAAIDRPRPAPKPAASAPTPAPASEKPLPLTVPEDRSGNKEEDPTYTLLKPGEHAGLDVFPPPGTKPVKRGIIVPDDFALPEGYVRHYQTTDDGRRLPPILMFHPDYAGVDASGKPVAVPEDRVVPPEMAPAGLPIQILDPDQGPTPASSGRAR